MDSRAKRHKAYEAKRDAAAKASLDADALKAAEDAAEAAARDLHELRAAHATLQSRKCARVRAAFPFLFRDLTPARRSAGHDAAREHAAAMTHTIKELNETLKRLRDDGVTKGTKITALSREVDDCKQTIAAQRLSATCQTAIVAAHQTREQSVLAANAELTRKVKEHEGLLVTAADKIKALHARLSEAASVAPPPPPTPLYPRSVLKAVSDMTEAELGRSGKAYQAFQNWATTRFQADLPRCYRRKDFAAMANSLTIEYASKHRDVCTKELQAAFNVYGQFSACLGTWMAVRTQKEQIRTQKLVTEKKMLLSELQDHKLKLASADNRVSGVVFEDGEVPMLPADTSKRAMRAFHGTWSGLDADLYVCELCTQSFTSYAGLHSHTCRAPPLQLN